MNASLEVYLADRLVRRIDVRDGTVVVVMTMGHLTDIPIVEALALKNVRMPYLGVIGSKSKAALMRRQLHKAKLPQQFIDAIVCPVGDKIGGNTPPEVALGVLSQLVRQRRQAEAKVQGSPSSAIGTIREA